VDRDGSRFLFTDRPLGQPVDVTSLAPNSSNVLASLAPRVLQLDAGYDLGRSRREPLPVHRPAAGSASGRDLAGTQLQQRAGQPGASCAPARRRLRSWSIATGAASCSPTGRWVSQWT